MNFNIFTLDLYSNTDNPILPKLNINPDNKQCITPYKINSFKIFDNKKDNNINKKINDFDINLYLLIHFNIENVVDAFNFLDNIIDKEINHKTIDIIANLILYNFVSLIIEDINIDKLVIFYQKYFIKYYNINLNYKIIFNNLKKNIITNITMHDDVVLNMNDEIERTIHTKNINKILNFYNNNN